MAELNKFNAIQCMEQGILSQAKERIEREVVNKLVGDFRLMAQQIVRDELEKMVIGSVSTIEEAAQMEHHLRVYVQNEDKKELKR